MVQKPGQIEQLENDKVNLWMDQIVVDKFTDYVNLEVLVREGNARETILEISQNYGPDLIVLGCRGHSLKKMVMGSVSQYVLENVSNPVLIVK